MIFSMAIKNKQLSKELIMKTQCVCGSAGLPAAFALHSQHTVLDVN